MTARGVEIDLEVRHRLTGNRAIAECKAYTSPVRGEFLQQFYGTLTVARFDDPDTQGFFIALPRLTAEGHEQAALITERDNKFRLLTASTVVGILNEQQITGGPPSLLGTSDPAVVVSEHGVFSAAIELDPVERTAVRVLAWGRSGQPVPMPVLELLSAAPDDGAGIPAVDISATGPTPLEATGSVEHEPLIATGRQCVGFRVSTPGLPKFFGPVPDGISLHLGHLDRVFMLGDETQLSRVVSNLVDNALRYARSMVELSVRQDSHQAVVSVSDDGPGISVADRERIWQKFARLDDDRSRASCGSGLGLAMVRELTAAHGGTVSVTSRQPGPGATFLVRLPVT